MRTGRWRLRGTAKVGGPVAVESAEIRGHLIVGGDLRAGELRIQGTADVSGPIAVRGAVAADGTLRGGASVSAQEARLGGSFRAAGAVEIERTFEIRGDAAAPSVKAGAVEIRGGAEIEGATSAGSFRAELDRPSRFGSIEARNVVVRLRAPTPVERALGDPIVMSIGRIEADTVEVERVDVEFVRAKEIRVGRDAHITTVEGTVVSRHPTSRIGPESRSPPPHGLSR